MNADDKAWLEEQERRAPKTAKEKMIDGKVEEIEKRTEEVIKKSGIDSQRFIIETMNGRGDVTSHKLDHKEFAEWLVNESGEHFITVRGDDCVYMYESGVYIEHGESFIKSMLYNVMDGECVTRNGESEVLSHVRAMTYSDRSVFNGSEDVINMDNGLYVFSTGVFLEHTPEYKTLVKSAVEYDPAAICPAIDRFFKELAEPERVLTLYEIMGYALMPVKSYKRGFIFRGGIDTGKSQYNGLLSAFVGEGATASVQPTTLAKYEHAGAELYGKLVNIIDDLGETPITDTGVVKAMIGDGLMRMNPKGKEAVTFRAHVLNLWCCNALPRVEDKHFGDKFDILIINNLYGGHSQPDPHLLKKITEPSELSGLFNKAMKAFKGVEERVGFTGSKSSRGRAEDWEHASRPISQFVDTRCRLIEWEPDKERGIVLKNGFQKAYTKFCQNVGAHVESKQVVKQYLEDNYCVFEDRKRLGNNDNARWCYIGIEIIPVSEIGDLCQNHFQKKPMSRGVDVSNVSTIYPMLHDTTKNSNIEGSNRANPDTNDTTPATDGENPKNVSDTVPKKPDTHQQSERIDFDQSTYHNLWADPNAEQKLKHAVGKAIAKNNRPDVDVVMINEAHAEHPGVSMVVAQLNDRGEALGITRNAKGLYRITI